MQKMCSLSGDISGNNEKFHTSTMLKIKAIKHWIDKYFITDAVKKSSTWTKLLWSSIKTASVSVCVLNGNLWCSTDKPSCKSMFCIIIANILTGETKSIEVYLWWAVPGQEASPAFVDVTAGVMGSSVGNILSKVTLLKSIRPLSFYPIRGIAGLKKCCKAQARELKLTSIFRWRKKWELRAG